MQKRRASSKGRILGKEISKKIKHRRKKISIFKTKTEHAEKARRGKVKESRKLDDAERSERNDEIKRKKKKTENYPGIA